MKQKKGPAMPARQWLLGLVLFLIFSSSLPSAQAAQVTLAWNPSTSPGLSTYRVRRGVSSGDYDAVFEVGNVLTFTDREVTPGQTYFYAVSAVNEAGVESRLSKELQLQAISNKRPTITEIADRSVASGGRIGSINFEVGDLETPVDKLTVTATSSRPDLVPPGLIQILGTGAERTATLRTLRSGRGTATIRLTVSDGELTSKTQFQVTVEPVSEVAPGALIAQSRSVTLSEDSSAPIRLTGAGGNPQRLIFQVLTPPELGRLSGEAPDLIYTPFPNRNGEDSFSFVVIDGDVTSEPGVISLDIQPANDAPEGLTDRITVLSGGESSDLITGRSTVLDNDTDADDDPLEAQLIEGPRHGVLAFAPDGSFVYRHGGSSESTDRFTYAPFDGETRGEPVEVKIAVLRVDTSFSVEDALVLEWPGQLGNKYQVEAKAKDAAEEDAPNIISSQIADDDKNLAVLIPPEGLGLWDFSLRCISDAEELVTGIKLPVAP